ncbi:hypothetical protein Acid345_1580 [Candidatus Koribacter versatilis Ellin345]|uniref:Type II secretion system protein n=1 Tax=Koribacter versatilis (strain Ellin345) TaxID=204669 RepID=Q1IRB8_KORVE|nr:type II secretion system protein [Candidatus Koribacter versatilis]ABF40582.1 hypothetical protein Acid345_1580 [Candidatus Koribacter versatilis Ellin345]
MPSELHNSEQGLKRRSFRAESGYMLLILMFFVALLTFSLMAVLPKVVQQVKRDREEEMIHRGTEYARAVKKFYKKFNRYPNSLQDLENTNNLRFIRRRYKDPMTKDGNWRLLHITDVQQGVANPNFGVSQASNFNPLGGGPGSQNPTGIAQVRPGAQGGDTSGNAQDQPTVGVAPDGSQGQNPPGGTATTGSTTDPGQSGQALQNPGLGGQPGQTYGAGGIVGVASMSKGKSIREFNNKSNYNKWMFIYDPTQDRGMLLKGPYNPQAFIGGSNVGGTAPGAMSPNGMSPIGTQQPTQQNGPGNQMPPDQNAPPQ